MHEQVYWELFRLIREHNNQPNMDATEKGNHLRGMAIRMDADGEVEEFIGQWEGADSEGESDRRD